MSLVEITPPGILKDRIFKAADTLPTPALRNHYFDRVELLGNGHPEPTHDHVSSLRAVLRSTLNEFGVHAPRAILRGPDDRPMPPFGARFNILGYTDCVGQDPETAGRIRITEGQIMENLGLGSAPLEWEHTEPHSPAHIRGVLTSIYLTERLKQVTDPYHRSQLVVLANAALRNGENPDAKGCPFVLAVLEGDAIVITTFNGDGIELQGVRPYVKELWHTTLGVEKVGNGGGKKPGNSFRSKYLLPFFEQVVNGNAGENLLDQRMDLDLIKPCGGIEIDSRDSFGNMKLNIRFQDVLEVFPFGTEVSVTVGAMTKQATIARSHGDGKGEEILIIPGTSPKHPCEESQTRADIVINSKDASERFINPYHRAEDNRIWAGRSVAIWTMQKRVEFRE